METCPICNLQYKTIKEYNHELTNAHLASNYQNFCEQGERIINLAGKNSHLQYIEHKKIYCEVCKKDINFNFKSSLVKFSTHIEKEVISRINSNLTDKTYTYLNPKLDQVDGLTERAVDGYKQFFLSFKEKFVFVVKFIHQTHGSTFYFTLTNKLKNQYEQTNESNELGKQINDFSEGESVYSFESITTKSIKIFKYNDISAFSYWKIPTPFCNTKSKVNKRNDDNYCFLWCILSHSQQVYKHRERISHFTKYLDEFNQGDIQLLMKVEVTPTFEQLNNLN